MKEPMQRTAQVLRLLGDENRLRILRLLGQTPLNVSEMTSILGLAQSGISRHLGQLRQIGLVKENKEGNWTYYQVVEQESLDSELQQVWEALQEPLSKWKDAHHDEVRLREVLNQRNVDGVGLNERLLEPGQSWAAWARVLGVLLPDLEVADLGCGDGTLTLEMARFAKTVVGVDLNPETLGIARQRIARMNVSNVTLLSEPLESLSIAEHQMDVAFFSQTLHHLETPTLGLREAHRILKRHGQVLIMELDEHQEIWVKEKKGHRWLGFKQEQLQSMMQEAGFQNIRIERMPIQKGELFQVLLASGRK